MKKILNIMTTIVLIFLFSFSVFGFYIEKNSNFLSDKTVLSLNYKYDYSHSEKLERIQKSCYDSDTDIAFVYYKSDDFSGEIKEIELYSTDINKKFLPFPEEIDFEKYTEYSTCISSNGEDKLRKKLTYPTVMCDYTIYPLTELSSYKMKKSECVTDSASLMLLSAKMSENFIEVSSDGFFCIEEKMFSDMFNKVIIVLLILLILSMIFYQFSCSKKTSVKLLDGYSFFTVLNDEFKAFLVRYIIRYTAVLGISVTVIFIKDSISVFCMYFSENIIMIVFLSLLIPFLFAVTCLYAISIKPVEMMKGKKYGSFIRIITLATKMTVTIVFTLTVSSNFSAFSKCYDEYQSLKKAEKNFSKSYSLTITERFVDEEKYIDFYKMVHKRFNAIMMTAHYCSRPEAEGDIYEWYIYVNDGYLKLYPVVSENGEIIDSDSFPKEMRTILVPAYMRENESEILEEYAIKNEVESSEINIIYYDNNQKFNTITPLKNSKYNGYIMHPIVIIHKPGDSVSGAISTGELVFTAHSDNFFAEIKPYLIEYGIDASTGTSKNVSENIRLLLMESLIEALALFIANVFLLTIIVITIIYESWVYYEDNKRKFIIKKMDGYDFKAIHQTQLLTKVFCYVTIVVFGFITKTNLCVTLGVCFADYIIFYGLIESKTLKYAAEILKGE